MVEKKPSEAAAKRAPNAERIRQLENEVADWKRQARYHRDEKDRVSTECKVSMDNAKINRDLAVKDAEISALWGVLKLLTQADKSRPPMLFEETYRTSGRL